ncbi:MAG: hypothetical protein K6F48_11160 [Paludibacteraceae bacterium]|nr:hypothetical protein [Paludibacteraceae bacterium]
MKMLIGFELNIDKELIALLFHLGIVLMMKEFCGVCVRCGLAEDEIDIDDRLSDCVVRSDAGNNV